MFGATIDGPASHSNYRIDRRAGSRGKYACVSSSGVKRVPPLQGMADAQRLANSKCSGTVMRNCFSGVNSAPYMAQCSLGEAM